MSCNGTYLFVTGFLRSGTTLLEKSLHAHEDVSVLSQPAPYLHIHAKDAFLRSIGRDNEQYPLGSLFGDDDYDVYELIEYLNGRRFESTEVRSWFASMRDYPGWLSPELAETYERVPSGTLRKIAAWIADEGASLVGKSHARVKGFKEVFSEELLPYFGLHGWKCIVIIRNPSHVWRSMRLGRGSYYANPSLSLIHMVRQWRKSVGYWGTQSSWLCGIRFEDLLNCPNLELTRCANYLGVETTSMPATLNALKTQDGWGWGGNSSFSGSEQDQRELPEDSILNWLCAPELALSGYPFPRDIPDTQAEWRKKLTPFLDKEDIELEWERLKTLASRKLNTQSTYEPWFPGLVPIEQLQNAFKKAERNK